MKLKDLIHFEEALLKCELEHKFNMPFNDYMTLDSFLTEIENITNLYFQLINDFSKKVNQENISNDERKEAIKLFNQRLLEEEITFNFEPYKIFMKKYTKYN